MAWAVSSSKNKWLQEKAQSIQDALAQGRSSEVWQDIRAICECQAGIQPVHLSAIKNKDGEVCVGPDEILCRWSEHFEGVLNVISSYDQATLDAVEQMPLRRELSEPPEILRALGKLTLGSMNGLLPDVLKCCGGPLLDYILTLFQTVWEERCVLSEWRDALLFPVPKKGDLSCSDNWRGISLLDVIGKLFARVFNDKLQLVVEGAVSDSRGGFRAGRGCVDMIFCVCQLVEKAIEHNIKMFLLFVDLRKAYDFVSRAALWCALRKYGVPDVMIELMRSLHDSMSATVAVGRGRLEPFLVQNGLRQGCTIYCSYSVYPVLWVGLVGVMLQVWKCNLSLVGGWLERELGDQTLLCCQSACLWMMLL